MLNIGQDIARGLEEMEELMAQPTVDEDTGEESLTPQTFEWKGAEVRCTPTTRTDAFVWVEGGAQESVAFTLMVRRAHFITIDSTLITMDSELYTMDSDMRKPVKGKKIRFRGEEYRVLAARETGPRSHFELDIGSATA